METKTEREMDENEKKNMHCEDCINYIECDPCSPNGFDGICGENGSDLIEVNRDSAPCSMFEFNG